MRLNIFYLLLVIILPLLTLCNNDTDLITLEDITSSFSKAEIHIKPQIDDDYLILNGIKPTVFEISDDGLYIYILDSKDAVKLGLKDINKNETFNIQPRIFQRKNVLILYFFSPSTDDVRSHDFCRIIGQWQ